MPAGLSVPGAPTLGDAGLNIPGAAAAAAPGAPAVNLTSYLIPLSRGGMFVSSHLATLKA